MIEFTIKIDNDEIYLKWRLQDYNNNLIKSSNELAELVLCKNRKCSLTLENFDQTKSYRFIFESEDLYGETELIIDGNLNNIQ